MLGVLTGSLSVDHHPMLLPGSIRCLKWFNENNPLFRHVTVRFQTEFQQIAPTSRVGGPLPIASNEDVSYKALGGGEMKLQADLAMEGEEDPGIWIPDGNDLAQAAERPPNNSFDDLIVGEVQLQAFAFEQENPQFEEKFLCDEPENGRKVLSLVHCYGCITNAKNFQRYNVTLLCVF